MTLDANTRHLNQCWIWRIKGSIAPIQDEAAEEKDMVKVYKLRSVNTSTYTKQEETTHIPTMVNTVNTAGPTPSAYP